MTEKFKMKQTVIVGMSGGVDSSVAAYLLKQQGYHVIGLFMKNWDEEGADGVCPAAEDFEDVVAVCTQLDIPYYSVNFVQEYWDHVFSACLKDYEQGHTPNPDILCNREIKFKVFLEKALLMRADFVATGHYCRKEIRGDEALLLKGIDPNKDQSYFLHAISQKALQKTLFPLGGMKKTEIRALAEEAGLITAQKKDSTGICFVGKRPFRPFLQKFLEKKPGNFELLDGTVVGQHEGLPFYTIGQRKGLGIGGPGEAYFVVGKDPERNVIVLVQGEDHPALYASSLEAVEATWIGTPPLAGRRISAKIRYRTPEIGCRIDYLEDDKLAVFFDEPVKAVTPRQAIVFYDGAICLGGAMIHFANQSLASQGCDLA